MKGYAVYVKGEFAAFVHSLEEVDVFNERFNNVITYHAHTEKKGYNTIVVCDGLLRKSDGTIY